MKPSSP